MGILKFKFLNIKINPDSTSAYLNGCWKLIRKEDNLQGDFLLELRKIEEKWKITKDSTSSY